MLTTVSTEAAQTGGRAVAKGRLKQSVCRWCYAQDPARRTCFAAVAAMGLIGVDLLEAGRLPDRPRSTG